MFGFLDGRRYSFFAPELRFSRRRRGQSEKYRGGQAPENSDGAGDAEPGERGIIGQPERAEAGHSGEAGEDDGLDHARDIVFQFARLLPDEEDVDAVVDPDGEDETEGEDVEDVERECWKSFMVAIMAPTAKTSVATWINQSRQSR